MRSLSRFSSLSSTMRRARRISTRAPIPLPGYTAETTSRERNITMEYELPDEIKMLRQAVREFAEKEVAPLAREIDEQERVPFETLKKAGELGLLGVPFPEQYGGADAGIVSYCVLISDSKLT